VQRVPPALSGRTGGRHHREHLPALRPASGGLEKADDVAVRVLHRGDQLAT
jgi:hypothetical protein